MRSCYYCLEPTFFDNDNDEKIYSVNFFLRLAALHNKKEKVTRNVPLAFSLAINLSLLSYEFFYSPMIRCSSIRADK